MIYRDINTMLFMETSIMGYKTSIIGICCSQHHVLWDLNYAACSPSGINGQIHVAFGVGSSSLLGGQRPCHTFDR